MCRHEYIGRKSLFSKARTHETLTWEVYHRYKQVWPAKLALIDGPK